MLPDLIVAALVLGGVGALCGLLLSGLAARLREDPDGLTEQILACLPNTQCAQCGYPGCRPYAAALSRGEVPFNRCPPGGQATLARLAGLLGERATALDDTLVVYPVGSLAWVDEDACIGCALCLDACPVDAIVGANRFAHTVIAAECTGCGLCLAPCPVDCIHMLVPGQ